MLGNELFLRPCSFILTSDIREKWQKELPPSHDRIIRVDTTVDSLADLAKYTCGKDMELSGAIGLDWISFETGSVASSPCSTQATFSWHSHPTGPAAFSFQDWVTFLVSDARVTCLFTPSEISLYRKRECFARATLERSIADVLSQSGNTPFMAFIEVKRLMENHLGLNMFPLQSDQDVAAKLNIDIGLWARITS